MILKSEMEKILAQYMMQYGTGPQVIEEIAATLCFLLWGTLDEEVEIKLHKVTSLFQLIAENERKRLESDL